MRRLFPLLVLSTLAAPLAARADGSIVLNARAGLAKPFGEAEKGEKVGKRSPGRFRSRRNLQFRFAKQLLRGRVRALRAGHARLVVSNACSAAESRAPPPTSPSAPSPSTASASSSRAAPGSARRSATSC